MLGNRSFSVVPYYRSPDLLRDGEIITDGAAGIQLDYNSARCLREFGYWVCVREFRVNAEVAPAC